MSVGLQYYTLLLYDTKERVEERWEGVWSVCKMYGSKGLRMEEEVRV